MRMMTKFLSASVLAGMLVLPGAYAADSASTGNQTASRMEKMNEQLSARFEKADTDHDGSLTLDEAKQGMPRVARNFTAIDTAGSGKITLQQIQSYLVSRMGSRQ